MGQGEHNGNKKMELVPFGKLDQLLNTVEVMLRHLTAESAKLKHIELIWMLKLPGFIAC